jgi:RHS repeat-associated protein
MEWDADWKPNSKLEYRNSKQAQMTERADSKRLSEGLEHFRFRDCLLFRASDFGFRISPSYYHFDALGSTRMLTDETGHITDTYTYDAWGNVTPGQNNVTSQPYQYVGQLGYYTHYQDSNLPLLQLGVRFYDPGTGRFGQVDPLVDGLNAYMYVKDRPTVGTDPNGLQWPNFLCRLACGAAAEAVIHACHKYGGSIQYSCIQSALAAELICDHNCEQLGCPSFPWPPPPPDGGEPPAQPPAPGPPSPHPPSRLPLTNCFMQFEPDLDPYSHYVHICWWCLDESGYPVEICIN